MPRPREAVHPPEGGRQRTKQADALETDINQIVGRYIAHGELPNNGQQPTYGDFTDTGTYHSALNLVLSAQTDFGALPSAVRKHVDNDPGQFLTLVHDPDRRGELEELGLVEKQAPETAPPANEPEPPPVAPVDPPI